MEGVVGCEVSNKMAAILCWSLLVSAREVASCARDPSHVHLRGRGALGLSRLASHFRHPHPPISSIEPHLFIAVAIVALCHGSSSNARAQNCCIELGSVPRCPLLADDRARLPNHHHHNGYCIAHTPQYPAEYARSRFSLLPSDRAIHSRLWVQEKGSAGSSPGPPVSWSACFSGWAVDNASVRVPPASSLLFLWSSG